ncbi:zinc finger protein 711-like isoform X3 [Choristoneura fumiferana]|uniref:zinc finger protein 711-like isoform X3 n=1 Tax=Choristoneura fumiferana TaxID=7141 RepID=UPI003D156226
MASPSPLQVANLKLTTIDLVGGIYCSLCHLTFRNKKDYDTHYNKHNLGTEEIVYTCVICHKDIVGYPSFRGHCYTNHVIKDRFKCEYCNKQFSKVSTLNDHIIALHKFRCSTCQTEFPTKRELQLHKIIHMNDKPPFPCQTCNEKVHCVDACEKHIDEHSLSVYTCPICSEQAENKADAVEHLTIHFGDVLNDTNDSDESESESEKSEDSSIDLIGGIFCVVCKTIFKNRAEIDLHFNHDHPEKEVVYSCIMCSRMFDKYSLFGRHCYEHINKNRFKCESCERTFSRLARLVSHAAAFGGACAVGRVVKPRCCPRCSTTFASEFRYREHQRTAHGICVIMCSQPGCGDVFETPKELILHHQKQHDASMDHWCRLCGLQFYSRTAAEKHLDVHKKKTFACPICAKIYGEKYLLMKHVPQHFETVIHICKVCGNLYNAKSRLKEHSKIHADVKNYQCSYCSKGFTTEYKLKQHHNVHTGQRPYKCTVCTKTFTQYSNWYKHLLKMHKIDPKTIKKSNPKPHNAGSKENVTNNTGTLKNAVETDVMTDLEMISKELSDRESRENAMASEEDIKESYMLLEPANEAIDLDSINPSIAPGSVTEFVLAPSATFVSEPQQLEAAGIPLEYGPDFTVADCGRLLHLDDHILPHIDPLLTIKDQPYQQYGYVLEQPEPIKWEPRIVTKYQDPYGYETDSRLAVMNTDIF